MAQPRWPALIALLAIGLLYSMLPDWISYGPRWTLLVFSLITSSAQLAARSAGKHRLTTWIGTFDAAVLTIALGATVAALVQGMSSHKEQPQQLLVYAAALWITNVLVFSIWYWRLDAGGPHEREKTPGHEEGAFLFPQMTMDDQKDWSPLFIDYLFLAFNTSAAFSPTDTMVLSRWAKVMTMVQSMMSLLIVVLLVARAINTL